MIESRLASISLPCNKLMNTIDYDSNANSVRGVQLTEVLSVLTVQWDWQSGLESWVWKSNPTLPPDGDSIPS